LLYSLCMEHLLIAHRGDTENFEENTIEAFASAFENGADGIELDIQERAGELIVVHNYLYDKTKTYPKLDTVLEEFAPKGRLEIEIKSLDLGFIEPLKKSLGAYSGANIELTTSVVGLVNHLRSTFQNAVIGVIFQDCEFEEWMAEDNFTVTKIIKLMQLYGANIAHIPSRIVDATLIEAIHDQNMKAHVHIPRQPMNEQLRTYLHLREIGVDQSTFDDINLLTSIVKG
jgi:glycerophosphoryl diester phosphodiesterase